ncbi:unnamed protein product [Tilletia controversa]|nr:unnamed protein product [Tilletia controversa]
MASQKPVEKIVEGIKTFNGENWPTWSYQVKTVLKGNGLWKAVDPGEPPAEDATSEVKDAWELKSDRAYAIVALSCDLSIQADSEFKKQVTPKDLFEHIRSEYASNTINARLRIKRELRTALTSPASIMRIHIGNVASLFEQLQEIGCPVDEQEQCIELLGSLPAAFRPFPSRNKEVRKAPHRSNRARGNNLAGTGPEDDTGAVRFPATATSAERRGTK